MLQRLEIENFYSIRERQTIDLRVAKNAPADDERFVPVWQGAQERVPKVVAFFGPNAAGKSNVLKALSFLVWFVRGSFQAPAENRLPFERFNDREALGAPARLTVWFSAPSDLSRVEEPRGVECRFAYEVEFGGPHGAPQNVLRESLFYWPSASGRRQRLFRREGQGMIKAAKTFGLSGFDHALEKILRPNASVLSTLAQIQHPFSMWLIGLAQNVYSNILLERTNVSVDAVISFYEKSEETLSELKKTIRSIDFGIDDIDISDFMGKKDLHFHHNLHEYPIPRVLESQGTLQFVKLFPILQHTLKNGSVAILDEFDASLHPMVIAEIIRWFHDPIRNAGNGQLWMTCQNTAVLEELAKEEIFFCEKDENGRTSVLALKDVVGVRRGENFYRKYLGGAYGAVPRFG